MVTAFLGSFGFGNLGDDLCLIEALERFGGDDAFVFSADPEHTGRIARDVTFFSTRGELQAIAPDRIVLGGGGVGFWPSLRDALHWMQDAFKPGVEAHIHNIGVGKIEEPEWFSDPVVRRMIASLTSFTVRDHVSNWLVREWGFSPHPGLTLYPEKRAPSDDVLVERFGLRGAPLLGVSITGQGAMKEALLRNRERVLRWLDAHRSFTVVPIISTVHRSDGQEDDIEGFKFFERNFLDGFEVAGRNLLDRDFWYAEMTPQNLKGLINACALLLSQRKHNCIHAIGCGTPFVGIHPADDDSLARIVFSLRAELAPGAGLLALP